VMQLFTQALQELQRGAELLPRAGSGARQCEPLTRCKPDCPTQRWYMAADDLDDAGRRWVPVILCTIVAVACQCRCA